MRDNRIVFACALELGCRDAIRYEHLHRREEPLLALPDAVTWCWAQRGQWASRVDPVMDKARRT